MSCEQCPGTWDVWIRREPGVRWQGRYHSCYWPLHGVGTDWFCIASEDYVCLQREIFESIHQKHLLMEFSRTNGLTYEINFFSLRTLKQKQDDNLPGGDSWTRRGWPLSLNIGASVMVHGPMLTEGEKKMGLLICTLPGPLCLCFSLSLCYLVLLLWFLSLTQKS